MTEQYDHAACIRATRERVQGLIRQKIHGRDGYHFLNRARFDGNRKGGMFGGVFFGFDMGPDVQIKELTNDRAIFRIGGHTAWISAGCRKYQPTEYILAVVEWDGEPGERGSGRILWVIATANPGHSHRLLLDYWYEPLYMRDVDLAEERMRAHWEANNQSTKVDTAITGEEL